MNISTFNNLPSLFFSTAGLYPEKCKKYKTFIIFIVVNILYQYLLLAVCPLAQTYSSILSCVVYPKLVVNY